MDAIRLLMHQHDEVKALFRQVQKAASGADREQIFARIADNLAAHCTIEEKIFYPAVAVGPLEAQITEATEEHLAAKRVIADLLGMSPADPHYAAKLKVLREEVEHHIEEEEEDLFPKVREQFEKIELEALGDEMSSMFDGLISNAPRASVPNEIDHAAPLAS